MIVPRSNNHKNPRFIDENAKFSCRNFASLNEIAYFPAQARNLSRQFNELNEIRTSKRKKNEGRG